MAWRKASVWHLAARMTRASSNVGLVSLLLLVARRSHLAEVLEFFDSTEFRRVLQGCCPDVAGLKSTELLRRCPGSSACACSWSTQSFCTLWQVPSRSSNRGTFPCGSDCSWVRIAAAGVGPSGKSRDVLTRKPARLSHAWPENRMGFGPLTRPRPPGSKRPNKRGHTQQVVVLEMVSMSEPPCNYLLLTDTF